MCKMLLYSIISAALLSGCSSASLNATQSSSRDPSHFTYTRIYCTPDTETHFESVAIELSKMNIAPPAAPLYVGGNRPASSMVFVGADARWGVHDLETRLNHPAPATQFVVILQGVMSVTTTDGATRKFRAGDVIRVEDTSPCKGHVTVGGDTPGFIMFVR